MATEKRRSRRSRPPSDYERRQRNARAMAMPTIGKWKGGDGYFHITFEGRRYNVNRAHGGYTLAVIHSNGHISVSGDGSGATAWLFKTPAQAVAAARKFSAREGWA